MFESRVILFGRWWEMTQRNTVRFFVLGLLVLNDTGLFVNGQSELQRSPHG